MSLFSNSNSNRRIKRGGNRRGQSLLEVSVPAARPAMERRVPLSERIGAPLKVVFLIALVVGLTFGGRFALKRLVWENPTYQLSDIRVSTDGLLTRKQVLEIMELEEGRNIFTIDLAKARAALDALPQVERLDVRRILPDRVDIRISERQPVAWVAKSADSELGLNSGAYLVDTRGYVMRMRKVMPEHLALPVITGVVMEDVAPGQKLPSMEALSALELIRASVDDMRWQPRVVDVSKGYCLVVTDQRRARITFGFDNIEGQLSRLRQLIDFVEPTQREFQTVNLMLERNVPVTFVPLAPPPAPVDPKTKSKSPATKTAALTPAQNSAPAPVPVPPSASLPAPSAQVAAVPAQVSAAPSGPVPSSAGGSRSAITFNPAPIGSTSSFASSGPTKPRPEPSEPAKTEASRVPVKTPPLASNDEPSSVPPVKTRIRKPEPVDKKEDDELRSPPKVERVQKSELAQRTVERLTGNQEKVKPVPVSAPVNPPVKSKERPAASDPASIAPSEALRKLFNPHG